MGCSNNKHGEVAPGNGTEKLLDPVTLRVQDLPNLLAKGEAINFLVTYQGRLPAYKNMGDYVDLLPLQAVQLQFGP
ncbi:hypothetical protein FE783_35520 [Paenibacillus mesophilus]|uniref:hypothetical protein n=1 Tax=Paenibacillus mesophilus TaxID=2582849 RepID=UPI00110E7766|nr:hypothetical protein [Paenibacillus mesophilus]TMV43343.1 hypothetical protein FE783_35520 [Paenibacillus mesophilus]